MIPTYERGAMSIANKLRAFLKMLPLTFIAIGLSLNALSQVKRLRYYEKTFQFSLVPGISTNGLDPAFYFNKFSFNLLFTFLQLSNKFMLFI